MGRASAIARFAAPGVPPEPKPQKLTQRKFYRFLILQFNSTRAEGTSMDVTNEWYWEGNIVDAVIDYLVEGGWTIVSMADTYAKEHGEDIRALKDGRALIVEAHGYPSRLSRAPPRARE